MESTKVLSPSKGSTQLQKRVSHDDKPAHEKIPMSAALQFPSKSVLGLTSPGQNTEEGDQGSDSEREEFQASLCIDRTNLDLNFQMEAWDDNSDSRTKKQGDFLNLLSSESSRASTGSDARLGRCTLQKSSYNFGLGELSSASDGRNDLGVSLDLQLKPPSKPQCTFNWSDVFLGQKDSDAKGIDLSLSMVGSHIKPEPCDVEIQANKEVEYDMQNLTSTVHVKSEPCQEDGTIEATGAPNLVSDCYVSTKRTAPSDLKGGGEDSSVVMSSDRMLKSVMGMPQSSCVSDFYNKVDNSRGTKVRDFYNNKFEIDLNSLPVDFDGDPSVPLEANEISAQAASELASHDHCADSSKVQDHDKLSESSSLLKDGNGIVAKRSTLVPEPMEIEQKKDDSKMVSLECNDSIASKVASGEVPMEVGGKSEAADSDEDSEKFEEVLEVSDEESVEFEEVLEEVSSDDESEKYEEVLEEVSCDDEPDDFSHHNEGSWNIKPEAEADLSYDEHGAGEVRVAREESALHVKDSAKSAPATFHAIMSSQDDATGNNIQKPGEGIKRESEATVPENLQPSAPGAPVTTKKRPLDVTRKMKQDLGHNKNFTEATEEGSTKNGWESWETKSGLSKDTAEPTKVGSTKNGWEPWETKSGIDRDTTAEASEKGRHASKRGGSWERSRVTNFKTGPERSSYGKRKPYHPRSSSSQMDRSDRFSGKPFRHNKPQPRWHRDDRRNNQRFHRFENSRNQANQFSMRRSDYIWQRESDDATKLPRTENVGLPSSRWPVRDASPQVAHEGRVVTRDLPGCSVNHPRFSRPSPTAQYVQTEKSQGKRSESPNIRINSRSFMPSPTPLECASGPQLRSPPVSEHNEMQSSRQHAYYTQNMIAPRYESKHDVMEVNHSAPQYSIPVTIIQRNTNPRRLDNDLRQAQEESFRYEQYNCGGRNGPRPAPYASEVLNNFNERHGNILGQLRDIKQRMEDIDHQQSQEESFRHEQYDHVGEQRADAGSYDQRQNCVRNGPRPAPVHEHYGERGLCARNVFDRLGDTSNGKQTEDAELCYERNFGVENGPRHFQQRGNPRESEGNFREQYVGNNSNGARGVWEQTGNHRFHGRKGWRDTGFSDAGEERRKCAP